MTSSLRRSSRAVSLCDRFKFSSQRRLCVLLTTILRPSVPGELFPWGACPSIDRGTYSSTALRASQHAPPFGLRLSARRRASPGDLSALQLTYGQILADMLTSGGEAGAYRPFMSLAASLRSLTPRTL